MRFVRHLLVLSFVMPAGTAAQTITAAGKPARLDIRVAGEASIRVTLAPLDFNRDFPQTPAVVDRTYAPPSLSLRQIERPVRRTVGSLDVEVRPQPLTLVVRNRAGKLLQQLVFDPDGNLSFQLDDQPVLGMGEGGPRPAPGRPWREQPVQFDRRGHLDSMEPRWQSDMYGSRNPVAMLLGTSGWGLFVATPWVQADLTNRDRGVFLPWKPSESENLPQTERNQQQNLGKGLPPVSSIVPGLYDFFVFDAHDPIAALKDFSQITGTGGSSAEVGPRLHAVAPNARGRNATARNHRHVSIQEDSGRCRHLSRDGFRAARLERPATLVRFQPRRLQARSRSGAVGHARAQRQGRRAHGALGSRQAADTPRLDSARAGRSRLMSRTSRRYWQQHLGLVRRRGRRVLAGRRRLVQSVRANQTPSALLPGPAVVAAERPSLEPPAQWISRNRAVGRLGVVR